MQLACINEWLGLLKPGKTGIIGGMSDIASKDASTKKIILTLRGTQHERNLLHLAAKAQGYDSLEDLARQKLGINSLREMQREIRQAKPSNPQRPA